MTDDISVLVRLVGESFNAAETALIMDSIDSDDIGTIIPLIERSSVLAELIRQSYGDWNRDVDEAELLAAAPHLKALSEAYAITDLTLLLHKISRVGDLAGLDLYYRLGLKHLLLGERFLRFVQTKEVLRWYLQWYPDETITAVRNCRAFDPVIQLIFAHANSLNLNLSTLLNVGLAAHEVVSKACDDL